MLFHFQKFQMLAWFIYSIIWHHATQYHLKHILEQQCYQTYIEHDDNDGEHNNEIGSQSAQLLQKATAIVEAYLAKPCMEKNVDPLTYFSTNHQDWPELAEGPTYVI